MRNREKVTLKKSLKDDFVQNSSSCRGPGQGLYHQEPWLKVLGCRLACHVALCVCVCVFQYVCKLCRTLERPSTCQRAVPGRNLQFTDESEGEIFWAPRGLCQRRQASTNACPDTFLSSVSSSEIRLHRRSCEFADHHLPILEARLGTPDLLPPISGEEEVLSSLCLACSMLRIFRSLCSNL